MTVLANPERTMTTGAANRRRWVFAGAWVALMVGAMIAMFWEAAVGAYRVWRGSDTFNHCFLVFPIVVYLLWDRRAVFSAMAPLPSPWLLAMLPIPVLAWLVGDIAAVLELQQFAAIATLQVAVATIIGLTAYRALLLPCLYLFLLVPTGEWLTPPLQDLTTWFVVRGLELLSIPVFADGVFIEIPNGRFEVAEACAGLRFLIASVAFGLLFAGLIYRSWRRRVIFVALSFIVPVGANGLRALGIVLLAHWSDNRLAVGVDHLVYGWGFFTAILFSLIWIGLRYREDGHAGLVTRHGIVGVAPAGRSISPLAAALAALAITSIGPLYGGYLHAQGAAAGVEVRAPEPQPPWRQVPWRSSWRPAYIGATIQIEQSYSDTEGTVDLFIAVYADQAQGRKLIGFDNRLEDGEVWRRVSDEETTLPLDGAERPFFLRHLEGREGRRSVWWIYWVNGHWTSSGAESRLRYILGRLAQSHATSAVLVLSSASPSEAAGQAAVRRFLAATPQLSNIIRAGGPQ